MKNILIVLSDPVPGGEDEYNDWYTGTHLREVVNTPGFVAAQRFQFVTSGGEGPPNGYLAIYEVEGDIEEAKAALAAGRDKRVPAPAAMSAERRSWW
jgi:hypothetical protein